MTHTFTTTIHPKGIPVNVKVMIGIFAKDEGEYAEFELQTINSRNYEYVFEELSEDDQAEITKIAQECASDLAFEAYIEKADAAADYAYDQWVDMQADSQED